MAEEESVECPVCGSEDVIQDPQNRKRYVCANCGEWFTVTWEVC